MNNNLISEELQRIKEIFEYNGVKTIESEIIIETKLLVEQGWTEAAERILDFLEPKLEQELDVYLPGRGEVRDRLNNFIYTAIGNPKGGRDSLLALCKFVADKNPKFAEDFVTSWELKLERLAKTKKTEQEGLAVIEKYFGGNITKEFEKQKPNWFSNVRNPPVNPLPSIPSLTPPTELNNSEKVKDFQTWLDKNHPDWIDTPLNGDPKKGYGTYGNKTNEAWETHQSAYKKQLAIGEKLKNIDYKKLSPAELTTINRFFSSRYTITNLVRKYIGQWIKSAKLKSDGDEQVIENIFSKLKTSMDEAAKKLKKGETADLTMFRDIMGDIKSLQKDGTDYITMVDEIEKILYNNVPDSQKRKVAEVIKLMKDNDPFNPNLDYRGSWLVKFIDETTWSTIIKGIFDKKIGLGARILNFVHRGVGFGLTGSVKKISNFEEYYVKYGSDWWKVLGKHLYFAKFVGMPLFLAFWQTIATLWKHYSSKDLPDDKSMLSIFEDKYLENLKGIFTSSDGNVYWYTLLEGFSPIHFYWDDWINTVFDKGDKVAQNKLKAEEWQRKLDEDAKKLKAQADSILNTKKVELDSLRAKGNDKIDSLKSELQKKEDELKKSIGPTQPGFIIWASQNKDKLNGEFNPATDIVSFNDSTKNVGSGQPTSIELSNSRTFYWDGTNWLSY